VVRSDVSLLILDVQDTITLLETELQHQQGESPSLNQTLFNMTQTIDKFAKFMKSNESNESQGPSSFSSPPNSAVELYLRLIQALCNILDSTNQKSIRQHTCRHILRLHLIQYPMNVKEKLSPDDARILLRTTRDMYLASQDSIRTDDDADNGFHSLYYALSPPHSPLSPFFLVSEFDPSPSSSSSSSTSPASSAEDVMTGGGINLILELLLVIWEQLKLSDGLNLFQATRSNNLSCKMFLEAGTHAAGILKSSSSKELNRKRLTHMGALNVMAEGIKAVIQVSFLVSSVPSDLLL
jgi:hypothetical protein